MDTVNQTCRCLFQNCCSDHHWNEDSCSYSPDKSAECKSSYRVIHKQHIVYFSIKNNVNETLIPFTIIKKLLTSYTLLQLNIFQFRNVSSMMKENPLIFLSPSLSHDLD